MNKSIMVNLKPDEAYALLQAENTRHASNSKINYGFQRAQVKLYEELRKIGYGEYLTEPEEE